MRLSPDQQKAVLDHLVAADFELRVASGFDCIKGTPAHDNLKSAVQQAQCALAWVRKAELAEKPLAMTQPPVGEGLPLTRKQRAGYRWT